VSGVAKPRDYVTAVGKAVCIKREQLGLTQMQVWRECETHYNSISAIERGLAEPTVLIVADVARGMGIKPGEIFVLADELLAESAAPD
jgi:transcriptional regulator with XRE-family HTH domain